MCCCRSIHTMEPADEVEIWEAILADPLDWPPSSVTIPRPSQVEEYFSYVYGDDDMEINKFAQEPEDGQCHQQYLGEADIRRYGEGRWTKVKRHYFSSSVREPTHLKDKWRNVRRACGVPCGSKRKEKAQKTMFRPLDSKSVKEIRRLAKKHNVK
ncbi:hypothetical protein VPH35_007918 [Triticum aestivum]